MTQMIALGDVAAINPDTSIRVGAGDLCSFVPMDAVDETTAEIDKLQTRPYKDVARGYTSFAENDVLLAKITPCMENGKCAIARGLRNDVGFGSTEFHVIRPSPQILSEWVYYYWRLPKTRNLAERNMTGTAGQKRVPTSFLEGLPIPLPSVVKQRSLIYLLQATDKLCRMRRHALQMCDELLPNAFLEMFGDPIHNSHNYSLRQIADICDLVRGSSPRPQGDPRFFGGPVPRLMIADITRDGAYVTPRIDSLTVEGASRSRLMTKCSVVMAVSADVGLPAILLCDACIHDGFVGFRELSSDLNTDFFYHYLRARKYFSLNQATGAIWQNLTTDQIKEWRVPVSPSEEQNSFAVVVRRHQQLRAVHAEALRQAEHLFQTLLNQAFRPS